MNGLFDSNSSLGLKEISKIPSDVSIITTLSMILRENVVLNRTVVDSDLRFDTGGPNSRCEGRV